MYTRRRQRIGRGGSDSNESFILIATIRFIYVFPFQKNRLLYQTCMMLLHSLNIMFKKTCFHYYVCGIPITNEIHHRIIYINSNTICVNHAYHCFNTLQFEVTIATRVLLAIFTQEEFFSFFFRLEIKTRDFVFLEK